MKRWLSILGVMAVLLSVHSPHADAQNMYYLNIILLVPEANSVSTPAGCTFSPEPSGVFLEVNQRPFEPPTTKFVEDGYAVDGASSPVEGVPGCLMTRTFVVPQAEAYLITMSIETARDVQNVNLGEISWDQYLSVGESPVIYVIDETVLAEGKGVSINFGPPVTIQPTPDYPATISALEAENASLRATIEAIQTPAP